MDDFLFYAWIIPSGIAVTQIVLGYIYLSLIKFRHPVSHLIVYHPLFANNLTYRREFFHWPSKYKILPVISCALLPVMSVLLIASQFYTRAQYVKWCKHEDEMKARALYCFDPHAR